MGGADTIGKEGECASIVGEEEFDVGATLKETGIDDAGDCAAGIKSELLHD